MDGEGRFAFGGGVIVELKRTEVIGSVDARSAEEDIRDGLKLSACFASRSMLVRFVVGQHRKCGRPGPNSDCHWRELLADHVCISVCREARGESGLFSATTSPPGPSTGTILCLLCSYAVSHSRLFRWIQLK